MDGPEQKSGGYFGIAKDVTSGIINEFNLGRSHDNLKHISEALSEIFFIFEAQTKKPIFTSNTLTKFLSSALPGVDIKTQLESIESSVIPQDLKKFKKILSSMYTTSVDDSYRVRVGLEDRWISHKSRITTSNSGQKLVVGYMNDITDLKIAEERLVYLAHFDTMTDTPNRLKIDEIIQEKINEYNDDGNNFSVIYLDLDRFKEINDTLGHGVGDYVLKVCADRIKRCLGNNGIVGRHGGDEFSIILYNVSSRSEIINKIKQVLSEIEYPFILSGDEYFISASFGVAMFPQDGRSAEELIKHADFAMYIAKNGGIGNIEFFNAEVFKKENSSSGMAEIKGAVVKEEFFLHFQPKIDAQLNKIVGFEGLIRRNNCGTLEYPNMFISSLEDSGLMHTVTKTNLRHAKIFSDKMHAKFGRVVPISLNISAREISHPQHINEMITYINQLQITPSMVYFELTEGSIIQHFDAAIESITKLKDLGFRVYLDDFGTGYSSLSYLRRFPIDGIKIDRSFIQEVEKSKMSVDVLNVIMDLAKIFNLSVIAEGVETAEQLKIIAKLGCKIIQGYYYSKPISDVDALVFMEKWM